MADRYISHALQALHQHKSKSSVTLVSTVNAKAGRDQRRHAGLEAFAEPRDAPQKDGRPSLSVEVVSCAVEGRSPRSCGDSSNPFRGFHGIFWQLVRREDARHMLHLSTQRVLRVSSPRQGRPLVTSARANYRKMSRSPPPWYAWVPGVEHLVGVYLTWKGSARPCRTLWIPPWHSVPNNNQRHSKY